jgi:hypothetical protein
MACRGGITQTGRHAHLMSCVANGCHLLGKGVEAVAWRGYREAPLIKGQQGRDWELGRDASPTWDEPCRLDVILLEQLEESRRTDLAGEHALRKTVGQVLGHLVGTLTNLLARCHRASPHRRRSRAL